MLASGSESATRKEEEQHEKERAISNPSLVRIDRVALLRCKFAFAFGIERVLHLGTLNLERGREGHTLPKNGHRKCLGGAEQGYCLFTLRFRRENLRGDGKLWGHSTEGF